MMGTYTANYQLYMPSIGEQGWGDLMNGNLTTIDTTMKGLNTRMGTAETNITSLTTRMGTAETTIASNKSRIGTLETETDAMKEKLDKIDITEENVTILDTVQADEFVGNVGNFSTIFVKGTTSNTGLLIGQYFSTDYEFNKLFTDSINTTEKILLDNYIVPSPEITNKYSLFSVDNLTGELNAIISIKSPDEFYTENVNTRIYVNNVSVSSISGITASYKSVNVSVKSGDVIKLTLYKDSGNLNADCTYTVTIKSNGNVYMA